MSAAYRQIVRRTTQRMRKSMPTTAICGERTGSGWMPSRCATRILAVSGKLDLTMGGPSVEQFFFKDDHSPVYDYARFDPDAPGNYRRSVYRFMVRSVPDPLMERFDCPDVSMITAKRTTTITAIQALALMNNPFVLKQAEHLAERVQAGGRCVCDRRAYPSGAAAGAHAGGRRERLTAYLQREGLENLCRLLLEHQRISVCGLRT